MRRRHVFGNIPLEVVVGNIPQMPLEDIYVEPTASRVAIGEQKVVGDERPVLELVTELLGSHHLVVIDQGFGAGKSLTARTLVWQLSKKWLESKSRESERLPVLIRCADTKYLPDERDPITSLLEGGVSGLTALLGCGDTNLTLADMKRHKKVVWVLDGLDELTLTAHELSFFYFKLHNWLNSNGRQRFVVTARTTVAQEALEQISTLTWFENNAARIALHYFDAELRNQWLSRWKSILVSSTNSDCEISSLDHKRLVEDDLYQVPLLLFMGAISGSDEKGTPRSKAALYEHFCTWVAVGKWHEKSSTRTPVDSKLKHLAKQAASGPHTALKPSREIVGPEREELRQGIGHVLYILSRLAWESVVIEQKKVWSGDGSFHDPDALPISDVERLLKELGYTSEEHPNKADFLVFNTVLLNAMGTKEGGANSFLFGHKSFREYLAVRYHLSVFLYMAENGIRSTNFGELISTPTPLEAIGRGDLLDYSEATREFVRDMRSLPQLEGRIKSLHDWCMAEVSDPSMIAPSGEPVCLQTDLRASWRFSCLGIRAAMLGASETSHMFSVRLVSELLIIHKMRSQFFGRVGEALILANTDLGKVGMPGASLEQTNLRRANLDEAILYGALLKDASLTDAKLKNTKLSYANLTRANLMGADLTKANLTRAKLTNTTLIEANLTEASLTEADLLGARLNYANLRMTNFYMANLHVADLRSADLTEARLIEADLTNANLINANLSWANLFEANLTKAKLTNANLTEANLINANLINANLTDANLTNANLTEANLSMANFHKANLSMANFHKANLSQTYFVLANLSHANLTETNLSGAHLAFADLRGANLAKAHFNKETQWPVKFDPFAAGAILVEKGGN